MRRTMILAVSAAMAAFGSLQAAHAETATAYVGTVLGTNAFDVQNDGNQLYYHPQPDTNYVWKTNTGETYTYTYGTDSLTANRDGMKTFACSNIAYGQRLDSIKLQFDYCTGADPNTGLAMSTPSVNVMITDGEGHYTAWSPTSGGTAYTTSTITGETGWSRWTLDCTNLTNSTWGKANEYNGGLTTDRPTWDTIKGWTIAGFYDYLAAPEGGYGAWNQTLWSDMTNVGVEDTTPNTYGIALIWGDTVGGMFSDGNGEIGSAAERAYGQAGRMINDFTITVNGTAYNMNFAAGTVPEPGTLALLAAGLVGLLAYAWRKRG